jgi:hypothetical protein
LAAGFETVGGVLRPRQFPDKDTSARALRAVEHTPGPDKLPEGGKLQSNLNAFLDAESWEVVRDAGRAGGWGRNYAVRRKLGELLNAGQRISAVTTKKTWQVSRFPCIGVGFIARAGGKVEGNAN